MELASNQTELLFTYLLILFETAEALAKQVTQENFDKGLIYPPFSNIRKISANIAANVAAKAYDLGECDSLIVETPNAYCFQHH